MKKQQGIANILRVFSHATDEEIAKGIAWYREAREFCEQVAKEYSVSVDVAIACLSALSPRNKWANNLKNVADVLQACSEGRGPDTVKCGTFHHNKYKAFRIVQENAPELARTSNKTKSFFDNIRYEESMHVTVDIWAFGVFHGHRAEPGTLTAKQYETIADAYRLAAKRLGYRPYELQAICWVAFQRLTKKVRVRKVTPKDYKNTVRLKLAA